MPTGNRFPLVGAALVWLVVVLGGCAFENKPPTVIGPPDDTDPAWVTEAAFMPRWLHLTYQHDPATTLTVQWQTPDQGPTAFVPRVWAVEESLVTLEGGKPILPFSASTAFEGKGTQYTGQLGMVTFVQWSVELTGLKPDTTYYTRAGTWKEYDAQDNKLIEPTLGPIYKIKTGLPAGSDKPFKMILAGDSRDDQGKIAENIKRLAVIPADFWLFNGDMTASGSKTEWQSWFDAMSPMLPVRPLMPTQGNHEFFGDLFLQQFDLPVLSGLPDELKEQIWSFDYGTVHFVGLNSISDAMATDLKPYLEADLKAARENSATPFIVVMFHHPAYSASSKHGSTLRVQQEWVPIFEKYTVDLCFSGHDHDYERTYPIRASQKADPGQGVVYLTAGAFYSPPYANGKDWWTVLSVAGDVGNYVVLSIESGVAKFTAYSGDGSQVLDEFELKK